VSPVDLILRPRREAARRRGAAERRTRALAAAAILTFGTVAVGEVARVWRRGEAEVLAEAEPGRGAVGEAEAEAGDDPATALPA
jgi:hypothetical protein